MDFENDGLHKIILIRNSFYTILRIKHNKRRIKCNFSDTILEMKIFYGRNDGRNLKVRVF